MILASRVAQVHRNQQSQGFQEQEHLPNIELKRAKWRSKNRFWATGQEPYCLTQNTHKGPFPKRGKKIHSLWHQWQIFASGIRGDLSSQHCKITMVVTIFTSPRAGPAGYSEPTQVSSVLEGGRGRLTHTSEPYIRALDTVSYFYETQQKYFSPRPLLPDA